MEDGKEKPDKIKVVKLNEDLMVVTDYATGRSGIVDIPRQPTWVSDEKWAAHKKTRGIQEPETEESNDGNLPDPPH